MSIVIQFFSFLWRVLRNTLVFLVSLPGLIFSAVVSVGTSIVTIYETVSHHASNVADFLMETRDHIEALVAWVNELPIFPLFYQLAALDVFFYILSLMITIFTAVFGTIFLMSCFWLCFIFIPFWIYRLVCKIVQLLTAGIAKPA